MTILQIAQIHSAINPEVKQAYRRWSGKSALWKVKWFSLSPRLARVVEASPQSWEAVIEGLRAAVEHSRGTARNAFANFATTVAAKTGTW